MNTEHMKQKLVDAFSPTYCEVIDDSAKHAGHAGALESGGGHYKIIIKAEIFNDIPPVKRHRMIYELFKDDMPQNIHALAIEIK